MPLPHRTATPAGAGLSEAPAQWTARQSLHTPRTALRTRRYEVLWRGPSGEIMDFTRTAPALPVFEEAFGAFARGTLIATSTGPVAIEDMLPGTLVEVGPSLYEPVMWIGAMTVMPSAGLEAGETLLRVAADTFGLERPSPDLMLGRHARYLHRADALKSALGTNKALAPVSGLVDGDMVIEVSPRTPVRTYHIGLPQHRMIRANGVELESYHPGANLNARLSPEMKSLFLSLFPHIREVGDFGATAFPRLSIRDIESLTA